MWRVCGKFKIRQLNPCGTFEETNLHFTSELQRSWLHERWKKCLHWSEFRKNSAEQSLSVKQKKSRMNTNFLTHCLSKFYVKESRPYKGSAEIATFEAKQNNTSQRATCVITVTSSLLISQLPNSYE